VIGAGNWNTATSRARNWALHWPRIWPQWVEFSQCSGSEQPCTTTAQGCFFIAQVAVTCAQVSKWKWNLERSRFGCEYTGINYHGPRAPQSYCLRIHHLCSSSDPSQQIKGPRNYHFRPIVILFRWTHLRRGDSCFL
jgi:hypothetical protein